MSEICEECPHCGADDVSRALTNFSTPSTSLKRNIKVGDVTKEFIEDARQDLQIQKKDLDKQR